jgi:hypothetical protein
METTLIKGIKQIQTVLKYAFTIVPVVAGLDKFSNLLTNWSNYLNPSMAHMIPFSPATFMMIVGVIEIAAGLIVFFKTEIGAYIVSAWLTLIALSLLAGFIFLDVAVRDLVMALSAFLLARMTFLLRKA